MLEVATRVVVVITVVVVVEIIVASVIGNSARWLHKPPDIWLDCKSTKG